MGVGAKLSKGRPKYRCVKTVDFGDFGVNAGLCVGRVFITKKDDANGFKFSWKLLYFIGHFVDFQGWGSKLKKSDVNTAASGGKSRFKKFTR